MAGLKFTLIFLFITYLDLTYSLTDSSCPVGKRCLTVPRSCTTNCHAKVTIETNLDGSIKFNVIGRTGQYAVIGISRLRKLKRTIAGACTNLRDTAQVNIESAWYDRENFVTLVDKDGPKLENTTTTFKNESVECSFGIQMPFEYNMVKFIPPRSLYIVLLTGTASDSSAFSGQPVGLSTRPFFERWSNFTAWDRGTTMKFKEPSTGPRVKSDMGMILGIVATSIVLWSAILG